MIKTKHLDKMLHFDIKRNNKTAEVPCEI